MKFQVFKKFVYISVLIDFYLLLVQSFSSIHLFFVFLCEHPIHILCQFFFFFLFNIPIVVLVFFILMIYKCSSYIKDTNTLLYLLQIFFLISFEILFFMSCFCHREVKQHNNVISNHFFFCGFVFLWNSFHPFLTVLTHCLCLTEFEAWMKAKWLRIHSNKTEAVSVKNEKTSRKCVWDHFCPLSPLVAGSPCCGFWTVWEHT